MLQRYRLKLLTLALVVMALQGCASSRSGSLISGQDVSRADNSGGSDFNQLREGDTYVFRSGPLVSFGDVTVGRRYNAASGRRCLQILDAAGMQLVSVACELATGDWYVREPLARSDRAVNLPDPVIIVPQTTGRVGR